MLQFGPKKGIILQMPRLVLLFKRLVVLLLGLTLVWFIVFNLYPWIDDRLPLAVALLVTYCFLAYLALPALVRIWHLLHKPTHVPTRSIARDGWALDPINVVVLAKNEKEFITAMQKAGWVQPDALSIKSSVKMIVAIVLKKSYPAAPFSTTYAFGKKQDLAFQIQINNNPRDRHHVRFWRLGSTILDGDHAHRTFWQKLLSKFLTKKKDIWVGAASLDKGVNVTRHTLQITHRQDGDTDTERDFLVTTLSEARVLKDSIDIKAGEPLHTRYQGFRETIIADGYVKLCELKRQFISARPKTTPPEQ